MSKKSILIICEYFYPGYLAGGPIQSLVNLVQLLGKEHELFVFTSAYDLGAEQPYPNIEINQWNTVVIGDIHCKVFYSSSPTLQQHAAVVKYAQPEWIYINGMYLPRILGFALWVRLRKKISAHYLIAPRGMFQPGAMATRKWQKKLYLQILKWLGCFNNLYWHATHSDEVEDIQREIGQSAKIRIAENIPRPPLPKSVPSKKQEGNLNLVYVSIISEKKNLHFLLEVLHKVNAKVSLHIYGPIKDATYWQNCQSLLHKMPSNISIQYCGDLQPNQVQSTIAQYDALVLLTKGENFGHALFESLSVGRPIITSHFTPWKLLSSDAAGWNIGIDQQEELMHLLEDLSVKGQEDWEQYCTAAWKRAMSYFYEERDFQEEYRQLFSA